MTFDDFDDLDSTGRSLQGGESAVQEMEDA